MNVCIGTYQLKEDKVFRNEYECAAWYEDVLVKAGTYPVEVYDYYVENDGEIGGHCRGVYVDMPGTVVSDYFGGEYCGTPIGEYDSLKHAGNPSRHSLFSYMVFVAKSIIDGDSAYKLDKGFEARPIKFVNYEGKEVTTYGIFQR